MTQANELNFIEIKGEDFTKIISELKDVLAQHNAAYSYIKLHKNEGIEVLLHVDYEGQGGQIYGVNYHNLPLPETLKKVFRELNFSCVDHYEFVKKEKIEATRSAHFSANLNPFTDVSAWHSLKRITQLHNQITHKPALKDKLLHGLGFFKPEPHSGKTASKKGLSKLPS